MTDLDAALQVRLDRSVPALDCEPDWADVLRRAGVRPRRHGRRLLAAALVAGALLATPALALRSQLHAFFAGQSGGRVEKDYRALPLDGRVGGVHERVERARRVTAWRRGDGSRLTLEVSVVPSGGFCWRLRAIRFLLGGCATEKKRASFTRPGLSVSYPAGASDPYVLSGAVTYAGARSLEVRYARGAPNGIRLVWISPPIDAGFFYFETPPGRKPTAVQLRDRSGTVVSRLPISPQVR